MDADGDTLAYEITGGADMGSFSIDNDGQITVKSSTELDYGRGSEDVRGRGHGNRPVRRERLGDGDHHGHGT